VTFFVITVATVAFVVVVVFVFVRQQR